MTDTRETETDGLQRACNYSNDKYWLCPNSQWRRFEGHMINGHSCKYAQEDYYTGKVFCSFDEYQHIGNDLKTDLNAN